MYLLQGALENSGELWRVGLRCLSEIEMVDEKNADLKLNLDKVRIGKTYAARLRWLLRRVAGECALP
jgi:hypothetical protein